MAPADWNFCVLALGAAIVIGYLPVGRDGVSAPIDYLLCAALFAIPAWALLQLIPLPLSWLAVLSPERAALTKSLLRFDPAITTAPLSLRPEATLQYALRYASFSTAFLIARDLMWRLPDRQWLIALPPLLIAIPESVIAILQDSANSVSVAGTFVNRNHFSAMLEMCLPFVVGAVFAFGPRASRALAACAGAAIAALLFTGIALSLSRGGFFIAIVSILLLSALEIFFRMRGTARVWALTGAVLMVAVAAVFLTSGRLLDRMSTAIPGPSGEVALSERLNFWKETLHAIAAYPITGCGFGAFVSAVTPWRATAVTRTLDFAHNDYLQFVAEGGIIALIPAVIVGIIVADAAWRGVFAPVARHRRFAACCAVALGAGMLHSAVDLITYVPATAMLLCWLAGMNAGLVFQPAMHAARK